MSQRALAGPTGPLTAISPTDAMLRRPTPPAVRNRLGPAAAGFAAAVFAAAGLLGGLVGCLTTLGPDIRRSWPHAGMTRAATRGDCLGCHETESHMRMRMQAMKPAEMAAHMQYITTVVHPPLVQDWMVQEPRDCVVCHAVRGSGG